jgi:hypothetical protein
MLELTSITKLVFVLLVILIPAMESISHIQVTGDITQSIQNLFLDGNYSAIIYTPSITLDPLLTIQYDPPIEAYYTTAIGLYVRANDPEAIIFYEFDGFNPTFQSNIATFDSPYIQVESITVPSNEIPPRNRTVTIVAVSKINQFIIRSEQYVLKYFIESGARPRSSGFLVPGVESGGFFVKLLLEEKSALRAVAASRQEFADFSTPLGVGTYLQQVIALPLNRLDPDLAGFVGGFAVNTSDGNQYGILVPNHNGIKFTGKVVRVNLKTMDNITQCMMNYRMESMSSDETVVVTGTSNAKDACIFVLDLTSLHPDARGFRKGFMGYPYAYLSGGQFAVPIRINMENFSIASSISFDLGLVDNSLGGHSGGFQDGTWSCFVPYKTFVGPVGGIRSKLPVDVGHTRPYYNSRLTCLNQSAWEYADLVQKGNGTNHNISFNYAEAVKTFNLASFDQQLRGFSEGIRVGRYAYLSPLQYSDTDYSGKLVRIFLGDVDIGTTLSALKTLTRGVHDILDVIDLSQNENRLKGYSGIFTAGKYIYLVPFRNSFEPRNGQRGHGMLTRVDMNKISTATVTTSTPIIPSDTIGWKGVTYLDLTITVRAQIPNISDTQLRGFTGGFTSGSYGILTPFYNGVFSGKLARFDLFASWSIPLDTSRINMQELDTTIDRLNSNVYKGYSGGFGSIFDA